MARLDSATKNEYILRTERMMVRLACVCMCFCSVKEFNDCPPASPTTPRPIQTIFLFPERLIIFNNNLMGKRKRQTMVNNKRYELYFIMRNYCPEYEKLMGMFFFAVLFFHTLLCIQFEAHSIVSDHLPPCVRSIGFMCQLESRVE